VVVVSGREDVDVLVVVLEELVVGWGRVEDVVLDSVELEGEDCVEAVEMRLEDDETDDDSATQRI
jgi:hypothetical protein